MRAKEERGRRLRGGGKKRGQWKEERKERGWEEKKERGKGDERDGIKERRGWDVEGGKDIETAFATETGKEKETAGNNKGPQENQKHVIRRRTLKRKEYTQIKLI